MNPSLPEKVIESFGLTDRQNLAAVERRRNVVVTAGAGSGKTRTLVARYVSLLAEIRDPRRVVAITFTDKAAREMRSRVRDALIQMTQSAGSEAERDLWQEMSARMDSARISTIHGLCVEILRNHPAEAGVDPLFGVLDEGKTAALRSQVVSDVLNGLVDEARFAPLFQALGTAGLKHLLEFMLENRLDVQDAFANPQAAQPVVMEYLEESLALPEIADSIKELRNISPGELEDVGRFEITMDLLSLWDELESALARKDLILCAELLYTLRREKMDLRRGKRESQAKDLMRNLQAAYDEFLNPVFGGKNKGSLVDRLTEDRFAIIQPLLPKIFDALRKTYSDVLQQRQALDFDDLEHYAVTLLGNEAIRLKWQAELDALLVDEFQDTNGRQRVIVEYITGGTPGRLFVVGDARQSIYRFRHADVTVFRNIQASVQKAEGLVLELDLTFRAHDLLLKAAGDILSEVMGTLDDPDSPFAVPFSPMVSFRLEAGRQIQSPYFEVILGCAEDSSEARPVMAATLAKRLLDLKAGKQIGSWDEVALLFRAMTGAHYYEAAFEEAGIPFVTISGRGFYDRPEIRDVLNILQALTDPTDDLAMAGALRSPAFGLADSALYLLRMQMDGMHSYWQALQGDLSLLDPAEEMRAIRARQVLTDLIGLVDRVDVAELIKRLVDATDYRAILAAAGGEISKSGRLWRNLDKLIDDAHASGQISVREFLNYLSTLSDSGAREGEATGEARGAVSLMSIHKAKGLEFPFVVLADAGRQKHNGNETGILLPNGGLAVKMTSQDPLIYSLAKWKDEMQEDAESKRLLYVALTRAKEKLIISGHATLGDKGLKMTGWLKDIFEAVEVDKQQLVDEMGTAQTGQTISGQPVRIFCGSTQELEILNPGKAAPFDFQAETLGILPLHPALVQPDLPFLDPEKMEAKRNWRATGASSQVSQAAIGQLIHKAIQLWVFPGDDRFMPFLETAVSNLEIAIPDQRQAVFRRAAGPLRRLRDHPLWLEINSAGERHHEVSYSRLVEGHVETGYIDLLYQNEGAWQVVDFKTDRIQNAIQREQLVEEYSNQAARYSSAIKTLLGGKVQVKICFLDDMGSVSFADCSQNKLDGDEF